MLKCSWPLAFGTWSVLVSGTPMFHSQQRNILPLGEHKDWEDKCSTPRKALRLVVGSMAVSPSAKSQTTGRFFSCTGSLLCMEHQLLFSVFNLHPTDFNPTLQSALKLSLLLQKGLKRGCICSTASVSSEFSEVICFFCKHLPQLLQCATLWFFCIQTHDPLSPLV